MFAKRSSSRPFSVLLVIVCMLAGAPHQAAQAAGECFVKGNATGTNAGTSWTNAYTDLQLALGTSPCTEIWVAVGTYKPTTGTDRSATFQLKTGVALYGGFAGTETTRDERDSMTYVATLSGDLNGDDAGFTNNGDNVLHVVTGATGATLDGFTITAGNANGGDCNAGCGGGMITISSNPILTNLIFSGNSADTAGGGMVIGGGSPTLTNVTFSGNSVNYYGGGMYNDGNPTLMNITFIGNSSQFGPGGGMYNNPGGNPTLTNVTFSGNSALNNGGGGMFVYGSSPTLTNVTFSGNSAGGGGGLYNYQGGNPQITNTIFWGNTATGGGAQIENNSSTPSVSDSVVQGGFTGTNIITTDPMLGTLGNYGGSTQTFPLLAGSSAIDTGDDATCAATDQRGMTRPQGAHCDIGAFEYKSIFYVKPVAIGTGNCRSWANACILQTALTGAVTGDEIWVAAGTYKPTTLGTGRSATFQLKNDVALYGGFAGTETVREKRHPTDNLTILSGDIDNDDSQTPIITDLTTVAGNTTNSYHVITGADSATLDGFTITAGYANGSGGGGMVNLSSSPTLTNVAFSGNTGGNGGGMYNNLGGPTMMNVTFNGNSGDYGAGMYNDSSSPTLTNVTFSDNSASTDGGGIFNYYSNSTLTNVTIIGNSANGVGGGMVTAYANPTLTNITFNGNSATASGGGLYNSSGSPQIHNSIFWGNTASDNSKQIYSNTGDPLILSDSVVQGGCPAMSACANLITTNPMLGTLGDYGGSTQTIPLLSGSSAIDTGDDATCAATDQRGVTRPQGAHCDIGAYELEEFTISGNAGVAGATLNYDNDGAQSVTADGLGDYSLEVSYNWSGTITPTLMGYGFSPASRVYSTVQADQTDQDYIAIVNYRIYLPLIRR